ncbi:RHS repeat domain-containing protein [Chryseobacterium sp. MYb328]|uniref:RHS repeat domain-containing protein n=1 Tax=Chryseobacterium sp. MYb328 TaxID=2745231 RepID=UPI0030998047
MKRKNIFSVALLFLCSIIEAQNISNILPPSPNAYSLYKVRDLELDKMSGTANFSIPIFEIVQDGVTIPISLSYNTGGIKVDERSGSVGLGWALNIPYDITKQIHGFDDDNRRLKLPDKKYYHPSSYPEMLPSFNYAAIEIPNAMLIDIFDENSIYDIQPDMYHYKLGAYSGKFFLDTQRKPQLIPYQPIQISSVSPMKINDFEGNLYEFNSTLNFLTKDRCSNFNAGGDFSGYNNYKISNITTKNKTNIFFKYDQSENYVIRGLYEMKNFKIEGPSLEFSSQPFSISCQPIREEHHKLITEILFDQGRIQFQYKTIRSDMEPINTPSKSLDEITIYDKNNRIIKRVLFSYNYFTSSSFLSNSNTYLNKRLKLTSLKMDNEIHEFEYYEDSSIPAINVNSVDYWGYHRGTAGATRIPIIYFKGSVNTDGVNREPDPTGFFTRIMSLKKIKYPTKGTLEIIYENNDYYGEKNTFLNQSIGIDSDNPSVVFTLGPQDIKRVVYFTTDYDNSPGGFENGICIGKVWMKENQGNYKLIGNFSDNGSFPKILSLDGEYRFTLNNFGDKKCFINAEYLQKKTEMGVFPAGGLRLKTLNYFDHDSKLAKQKQYRYVSDTLGYTSSIMMGLPNFINERVIQQKVGTEYEYKLQYLISSDADFNHSLNSNSSVSYTQVDEFLSDGNKNNGKIKSFNYIDSKFNFSSLKNSFSYRLVDDWKNHTYKTQVYDSKNQLLEYNEYFYKIYRAKNELSADAYGKYIGYAMSKGVFPSVNSSEMIGNGFITIRGYQALLESLSFYGLDSGLKFLAESRNYKILNGKPVLTKENKEFQNSKEFPHLLLSSTTTDPDGSVIQSKYQYAHEKGNQLMISKNMIRVPLEVKTSKTMGVNSKMLTKTETLYPSNQSEADIKTSGLVLPYAVLSTDLQNVTSTDVTYDKYDSKGNLLQYTTKDGAVTVIIWGYNQTKPIAKIENIRLTDIQQSFIDSIVNASDLDAAAGANNENNLLNAFQTFRANLSGHQVTTYSYDPLIGVRSITPPSGIRESYLYDSANRLEKVVDANGKILREMKYNYKN